MRKLLKNLVVASSAALLLGSFNVMAADADALASQIKDQVQTQEKLQTSDYESAAQTKAMNQHRYQNRTMNQNQMRENVAGSSTRNEFRTMNMERPSRMQRPERATGISRR